MADLLMKRRQWFSFFPEGTLEFLVVTRVLALMLLGTLVIVPSSQRSQVLTALAAVVWIDYALTVCWLAHLASDLEDMFESPSCRACGHDLSANPSAICPACGKPTRGDPSSTSRRSWDALLMLAPSVFAFLAIAPWPQIVPGGTSAHSQALLVLRGGSAALFAATLIPAYRALRRHALPSGWRTAILLIPIAHWFALHRLLASLHARVRDCALNQRLPVSQESGAGGAAVAADAFLVIGVFFWLTWGVMLTTGRTGGILLALIQAGAIGAGGLFAITEVAALEYLQRRFVALIRRASPGPSTSSQEATDPQ